MAHGPILACQLMLSGMWVVALALASAGAAGDAGQRPEMLGPEHVLSRAYCAAGPE